MPSEAKPHQPRFVLRQHCSAVLCCSFYPITGNDVFKKSIPNQDVDWNLSDDQSGQGSANVRGGMGCSEESITDVHSIINSHYFLTGDVDGICILWDLRIRKPVLIFQPVLEASKYDWDALTVRIGNESVLGVGFFPCGTPVEACSNEVGKSVFPDQKKSCSHEKVRGHQSFSLPRRRFFCNRSYTVEEKGLKKEQNSPRSRESFSGSGEMRHTVHFFTQCRNQKLYIWEYCHQDAGKNNENSDDDDGASKYSARGTKKTGLILLRIIQTPQHGFCQVSCSYEIHFLSTNQMNAKTLTDQDRVTGNRVMVSSYFAVPLQGADGRIAVCRADSALHMEGYTPCKSSLSLKLLFNADGTLDPGQKNWVLNECQGFRLASTFRGGTIMSLYMCKDTYSLAAAFESGHVVLFCFRSPSIPISGSLNTSSDGFRPFIVAVLRAFPEACVSCLWENRNDNNENEYTSSPEKKSKVLAASADGIIHCYFYTCDGEENCSNAVSSVELSPSQHKWSLQWTRELPNGVGQLHAQSGIVLAGCWDSTVRLFSLSSGRILSILTHHQEAVNALCVCNSPPLRYGGNESDVLNKDFNKAIFSAIGPESRQNKMGNTGDSLCTADPNINTIQKSTMLLKSNESLVHAATRNVERCSGSLPGKSGKGSNDAVLFASASKDHSVAVWMVEIAAGCVVSRCDGFKEEIENLIC